MKGAVGGSWRGWETISSLAVWKKWEWLEGRSPAFRPGEDLWQRDGMIVCEGVLEPCGFIGVDVQAFLGLGPGCSTGCQHIDHETEHLIKANMGLWVFTQ